MWKFHNCSNTYIFREIIYRNFEGPKTAILTHLEALNCDFSELLHFLKAEMYQIHIFRALKIAKMAYFEALPFSKIDFT